MAYCKKCGAELPKNANYCSLCGASVKEFRKEEFNVSSDDLIKTVKKLIHEGNVRRIVIKDEKGKIMNEVKAYAAAGRIGRVLAARLLPGQDGLLPSCSVVWSARRSPPNLPGPRGRAISSPETRQLYLPPDWPVSRRRWPTWP